MKHFSRWAVATSITAALVLLVGDASDPWLWAYVAAFALVGAFGVASMGEDLARERFTPPTSGADRIALRIIRLVALAHLLVGLLDTRHGWSAVSPTLRAVGLAGFVLSFLVIVQAMRTNRYFSAVVRIQSERGHAVVDTGVYSVLRHPGYAGMILAGPMSGLALGSWPAVAAGLVYSALILRRVHFEDRFLQEHLRGYRDYAARVRARLIPGVW